MRRRGRYRPPGELLMRVPLFLLFGIGFLLAAGTFFFLKGFFLSRVELGVFSSASELPFPLLFPHLHPTAEARPPATAQEPPATARERVGGTQARQADGDRRRAASAESSLPSRGPAASANPAAPGAPSSSWVSVYPYERLLLILVDALRFDFAWWEPGKRPVPLPPHLKTPRFSLTPWRDRGSASTSPSPSPDSAAAPQVEKAPWTQPRDLSFFSEFFGEVDRHLEDSTNSSVETPEAPPHHNYMPFLHFLLAHDRHLVSTSPFSSRLFIFEADAPTATTQRLKALGSGTVPTFFEIRESFDSSRMTEDSLLWQLRNSGRASVALGDETWESLYGHLLTESRCSPSFDIHDIHTVDEGVLRNLGGFLPYAETQCCPSTDLNCKGPAEGSAASSTSSSPVSSVSGVSPVHWSFVVGHTLGVDHVGHKAEVRSPLLSAKLRQMDRLILNLVIHLLEQSADECGSAKARKQQGTPVSVPASPSSSPSSSSRGGSLDAASTPAVNRTLLMVMGDHGMTDDGAHGGALNEEIDAALFVFSLLPFSFTTADVDNFGSPLPLFPTPLPPYIRHHSAVSSVSSVSSSVDSTSSPAYRPRRIRQVDWTSTVALLLGLPIPFSSLGSLIPDIVPSLSSFVPACGALASNASSSSPPPSSLPSSASLHTSLAFRCNDMFYLVQLQHIVAWNQRRAIDAYVETTNCRAVVDDGRVRRSWTHLSELFRRLQSLLARLPPSFKRRLTMQTEDISGVNEGPGREGNGLSTNGSRPFDDERWTDKAESQNDPSSPPLAASSVDGLVAEILPVASAYARACAEFSRAVFDASKVQFSTFDKYLIFMGILVCIAAVVVLQWLLRLHEKNETAGEPSAQTGTPLNADPRPRGGFIGQPAPRSEVAAQAAERSVESGGDARTDPQNGLSGSGKKCEAGEKEIHTTDEEAALLCATSPNIQKSSGASFPATSPCHAALASPRSSGVYLSVFSWWRKIANFYGTFVVGPVLAIVVYSDCYCMREHAAVRFLLSLAVAAVGVSLFLATQALGSTTAVHQPEGAQSCSEPPLEGEQTARLEPKKRGQASRRQRLRAEKAAQDDGFRGQRRRLRENMFKTLLLLVLLRVDGLVDPLEALPGSQPAPIVMDSALLSSFLVFLCFHFLTSPFLKSKASSSPSASSSSSSSSSLSISASASSFRSQVSAAIARDAFLSLTSSVVQWSFRIQCFALSLYFFCQVLTSSSSSFASARDPAIALWPWADLSSSFFSSELPFFLSSSLLSGIFAPVFAVPAFFFALLRSLHSWAGACLSWMFPLCVGWGGRGSSELAGWMARLLEVEKMLFTSKGNARLLERSLRASALEHLRDLAHHLVRLLPRLVFLLTVLTTGYALASSTVFALPFSSRLRCRKRSDETEKPGSPTQRDWVAKRGSLPPTGAEQAVATVVRCLYTVICGLLPSFMVLLGTARIFPLFITLAEAALLLDLLVAEFYFPADQTARTRLAVQNECRMCRLARSSFPESSSPFSALRVTPSSSSGEEDSQPPPSEAAASTGPRRPFASSLFLVPEGLLSASLVLMTFHVFSITGHRMTFNDIPVEAAFVGLTSFHSVYSIVLTFLHVFFPFLLLPLVLAVLVALRFSHEAHATSQSRPPLKACEADQTHSQRGAAEESQAGEAHARDPDKDRQGEASLLAQANTADEGRKRELQALSLDFSRFAVGLILFAAVRHANWMISLFILRRHLMVWSVFAPKFLYDAQGLFTVHFVVCFCAVFVGAVVRKCQSLNP
ncbi:putative transmembrane protein [Toxoplasma gondii RUB]|uniref:GPI ethanolamine phosphate transferase 3 n=2 Tax=Toxoplasma gondii TaxID=5811 RepID=B9Q7M6_TOXGV|nr:putative transmembrane protein [Toxoplasma gondii VEG]KFG60739.1 putative transmembrane protein [Toxoplasma gondii RUB]CEL76623.1 TPA: GPI ethanolamine phosphate transferase 3 [Toxoplasma gondii VEG]